MAIINISSHIPQEGDCYFLDCNVLMYNFYTNGSYASDLVADYSSFLSNLINAKANIYLTDVIVSEFVNTYIQTEFHRLATLHSWPHSKVYFKNVFKKTQEYEDILKEIKYIFDRQLFPISKRIDVNFSEIALDDIFNNPQTFDFNDRYYGLSMEKQKAYIVTNDADFSNISQCDIITRNQDLLNVGI